jgi:hypothetical protein
MFAGNRVKITGQLKPSQACFNGLEGEVSGIDAGRENISVILDIGITLAVNPENLLVVETQRPIFVQNDIVLPHILPEHLHEYLCFAGSDGWRLLGGG